MENAVRISVPVWVTILIITVVFSAFGGWSLSAKTYMEQESKQMENTQLHINQMLLKNLMISNDKQVLEEAVKNIKMAQKALYAFDEKHLVLNDQMKKTMRIMQEDYESMYHMLHKYLIEFQ